jgi:Zn-dependent protease
MKAKLASIRTTLDHLLIAAFGALVVGLAIALVDHLAGALMLAGLLGLELLIAVALANGAVGLAETASNNLGPSKRAQVLRVRARLGGARTQIAPLTEVETEELRVLEAGLDALENRRRDSPDRG